MSGTLAGRLVLVGAGKMGGALLEGWLRKGIGDRNLHVIDPQPPEKVKSLAKVGDIKLSDTPDADGYREGDVIVLAVKPQIMAVALEPFVPLIRPGTLVVSVAAGLSIAWFEERLCKGATIVRAMPNLPASIGEGITVAVANEAADDRAREVSVILLGAVGRTAWTETEADIDAVTAVSGSGPAYIFLMIEALTAAGVMQGLSEDLALTLAIETVRGAGVLAAGSQLSPATLRENVTSPGGTTAAALEVLMAGDGLVPLVEKAVAAAAVRSRELGE